MRILAIGAHFDDVELGCGGTLIKHREKGDDLYIMVVTHSGYESSSKKFIRTREQAKAEGEKSALTLGASLICCDKEPLILTPTESLVLDIENLVNTIKPDRVYTHQSSDSHADHAAVGFVSMRACRKCPEVLMYRSNWYIMDNGGHDNYYVNISDFMEQKMALIGLFESEMKHVNFSWSEFVKQQNSAAGLKVNVPYAETFHLMKMYWD